MKTIAKMETQLTLNEMLGLADKITSWNCLPVRQSHYSYKNMIDEVQTDTTTFYEFEGDLESTTIKVSKIESYKHWPGSGRTTSYTLFLQTDGITVGSFEGMEVWPLYLKLENKKNERKQQEQILKQEEQDRLFNEAFSKTKSLTS